MTLAPRLRAALVALVAATVLAGCATLPPLTALSPYAASDGLQVSVGDIHGINLILVTADADSPALLTGTLTNSGSSDATVTVTLGDASETLVVPAGGEAVLGTAANESAIVFETATVAPGLIANATVTVAGESADAPIPVLDGTFPHYREVLDHLQAYLDAQALADITAPDPSPSPGPSPSE